MKDFMQYTLAIFMIFSISISTLAQQETDEMKKLRQQLNESNQRIDKLTTIVEDLQTKLQSLSQSPKSENSLQLPLPDENLAQKSKNDEKGKPPKPSTIDTLIAPKSAGGQFSGAEGLIKTDRLKIGGYVDFRYLTRGLDEGVEIRESIDKENPDLTGVTNFKRNGFTNTRFVIGMASALTDKLLFNSELELEFSGKEVSVEQAYLEYRFHPMFNLRGGVLVPPLGRFNTFHDANLQDIINRPLTSTFIIPSTYKDAGIGALGEFKLGSRSRLTYEAYIVNGLRSDEGGEFAREAGLFESKGNNRFFDNNSQKSVIGRLGFSPMLGTEVGFSGYRGKHDNQGQHNLSIWALDWKFAKKGLQVLGEYARTSIQRAPETLQEIAAKDFLLSLPKGDYVNTFEFIDQNLNEPVFDKSSRSMDGFYIEARYRFHPQWLVSRTTEDASIAPVFRFDQINLDRQYPNFRFPLNMRRASLGLSIRPTEAVSFSFTYHIDRKPAVFLRLPDGRAFPPYFTNLGAKNFSFGMAYAF